jgi:hypothetical protein
MMLVPCDQDNEARRQRTFDQCANRYSVAATIQCMDEKKLRRPSRPSKVVQRTRLVEGRLLHGDGAMKLKLGGLNYA